MTAVATLKQGICEFKIVNLQQFESAHPLDFVPSDK